MCVHAIECAPLLSKEQDYELLLPKLWSKPLVKTVGRYGGGHCEVNSDQKEIQSAYRYPATNCGSAHRIVEW